MKLRNWECGAHQRGETLDSKVYLLHIGNLDWAKINPDIFGSMIQAVTEDEERGGAGIALHERPNILKLLRATVGAPRG